MKLWQMSNQDQDQKSKSPKSPIDKRVIIILLGIAVVYQIFNASTDEIVEELDFFEGSLNILYAATSIAAFTVARRYWGSDVFGKAYLSLSIAFACVFIGDFMYNYLEIVVGEVPYPSIADVFYFGLYPFSLFHFIKNCRYFRRKWSLPTKIWLVLLPVALVSIYSYVSINEYGGIEEIMGDDEATFDFFYSLIFVSGAASTTTFAVLGILVFRQSALAATWALLAAGIFLNDVSDFWYYFTELTVGWERQHPTTTLWVLSNLIIIYSLHKHKKTI